MKTSQRFNNNNDGGYGVQLRGSAMIQENSAALTTEGGRETKEQNFEVRHNRKLQTNRSMGKKSQVTDYSIYQRKRK